MRKSAGEKVRILCNAGSELGAWGDRAEAGAAGGGCGDSYRAGEATVNQLAECGAVRHVLHLKNWAASGAASGVFGRGGSCGGRTLV